MASTLSGLLTLTAALACADLDSGEDTYCDTVGSGVGACAPPTAEPDSWSCLANSPPTLPTPGGQLVGFVQPIVEWGTLVPLAGRGLTASLCSSIQFSCSQPLNSPAYTVTPGMLGSTPLPLGAAGIPVPEGFDGFLKFNIDLPADTPAPLRFVPETYYLGGKVSGPITQGPPLLMLQQGSLDVIFQQSFPLVNAATARMQGAVVVGAYDCNGAPVADARIEINVADTVPFLLPASRIPISQDPMQPLFTAASGNVGFLNVKPGALQIRAFRRGDTQPFGTAELGAVGGEITVGSIRPPFLNDANVRGVPVDDTVPRVMP